MNLGNENSEGIDLHSLRVFRAVAVSSSFTEAGKLLGLTQSAVSRQVKDLEAKLGVALFERTTRRVRLSPAGEFWLKECEGIFGGVSSSVRNLQSRFSDERKRIRVGVSATIPYSHLPGLITQFRKRFPEVKIELVVGNGEDLLLQLENFGIDLAVLTRRRELPESFEVIHHFTDQLIGIAPLDQQKESDWSSLPLVGLTHRSEVGRLISRWLADQVPGLSPAIEVDSFDLMVNLISMGLGAGIVPARTLASYGKRKPVRRWSLASPLSREVAIVGRADSNRPELIDEFVGSVLFSSG